MREILFRGKDENGEWHEGSLVVDINQQCSIIDYANHKTECYTWHDVIPETVGQFTGLTDKNGVKVFESDIVLHEDYSNGACVTFKQFESKSIVKINNLMNGCSSLVGLPNSSIKSNNIEVIGNIHDNKNLL